MRSLLGARADRSGTMGPMSFTLTIRQPTSDPLSLADLRREVGLEVEALDGLDPERPIGGLVKVYLPKRSSRSVELEIEPVQANVRILSASTLDDHDLAIRLAKAVAEHRGAAVVAPEGGDPVPLAELGARYGPAWAADEVESAGRTVATMIDRYPGRLISLDGPVRRFEAGPGLLARLSAAGPRETLGARLVEAIRASQWLPPHREASLLEVSRDHEGLPPARLAVLSPGGRTLLPGVDAIVPWDPSGPMRYVRPTDLAQLLGDRAHFVDERRLVVEPVPEAEWAELISAAAGWSVELEAL